MEISSAAHALANSRGTTVAERHEIFTFAKNRLTTMYNPALDFSFKQQAHLLQLNAIVPPVGNAVAPSVLFDEHIESIQAIFDRPADTFNVARNAQDAVNEILDNADFPIVFAGADVAIGGLIRNAFVGDGDNPTEELYVRVEVTLQRVVQDPAAETIAEINRRAENVVASIKPAITKPEPINQIL